MPKPLTPIYTGSLLASEKGSLSMAGSTLLA
jgi:hypothetical protein